MKAIKAFCKGRKYVVNAFKRGMFPLKSVQGERSKT